MLIIKAHRISFIYWWIHMCACLCQYLSLEFENNIRITMFNLTKHVQVLLSQLEVDLLQKREVFNEAYQDVMTSFTIWCLYTKRTNKVIQIITRTLLTRNNKQNYIRTKWWRSSRESIRGDWSETSGYVNPYCYIQREDTLYCIWNLLCTPIEKKLSIVHKEAYHEKISL